MKDTEARLLALENKVKEQQEAIKSFDRMFLSVLVKLQDIDLYQWLDNQTIDTMLTFLERIKPQIDDLWQDFQFRQVRKKTDMLN